MDHSQSSSTEQAQQDGALDRNRLEVIRFASAQARRQAIRALLDYGMLNFTSYQDDEWLVRTSIARKLRDLGVPFEWLTEHA
jgi:hypothetical protein